MNELEFIGDPLKSRVFAVCSKGDRDETIDEAEVDDNLTFFIENIVAYDFNFDAASLIFTMMTI